MVYIKPLLKWLGGKTQIIDKIIKEFPIVINDYIEPFVGGGSVLLALLCKVKNKDITIRGKIQAYDLNETLIYFYKNIQSNPEKVYNHTITLVDNYTSKSIELKEEYYYQIRDRYNKLYQVEKNSCYGSALFLFLNKTCFRGIFRESKNGFNVPFGHYKNPSIIDLNHLMDIYHLIKDVEFNSRGFDKSIEDLSSVSFFKKNTNTIIVFHTKYISPDNFIYLDPPYAPEINTSFVSYTKDGFDIVQHSKLFVLCNQLKLDNRKFLLSNSDTKMVRDYFPADNYNIKLISCKRSINSKNPNSKTNELLIKTD